MPAPCRTRARVSVRATTGHLVLRKPLVIWLSFAALFLAASYPFTKRFLAIPQAYLGIAFGFGIPMSYAAQLGNVPAEAWWLLLANIFWAIAYDTEYAMVDREDDLKIGIKTSAITFGRFDVAAVMLCYGATLASAGNRRARSRCPTRQPAGRNRRRTACADGADCRHRAAGRRDEAVIK